MTESRWRSRVRGVLTDGRPLPETELDGFADNDLEAVRDALEPLVGARVAILRYLERSVDRERKRLDVVYELERLDAGPAPSSATVPATRAPWAQAGWLAEATTWIESSLRDLGRAPTGPVEQVRTWPLSAVLRVPTENGRVYFKATSSSPLFVDEGRVMTGLAGLFRHEVPRPLAIDSPRRWMLLDDIGDSLGWQAPVEVRESVLRVFAFMQVASSSDVAALLEIGCIDRRPAWLARETRQLLGDDEALAAFDEHEIARLRALEPVLVELCDRLAKGPVPNALVHGDLHLENVARVGGSYVFFDWSDACVTHPFLDLIDVHREEDAAVRERLRDAYLSAWADYGSPQQLRELWDVSAPLASLNQAVSYRHIAANVEPASVQQLESALPDWLRRVLETDFDALR